MARLTESRWPSSLARLPLFADASAAELRRIGSLLTLLTLDAGEVLIRQGSIGLEFLIIAAGQATVTADGQPLAVLGTGDFVGEMALLERVPRSATVIAETPITFYVCNSAEFATLLDVAPSVRAKIVGAARTREEAARAREEANRAAA